MKQYGVLLICGGGFSSGFMAKSLRESAAKKGSDHGRSGSQRIDGRRLH